MKLYRIPSKVLSKMKTCRRSSTDDDAFNFTPQVFRWSPIQYDWRASGGTDTYKI